MKTPRWISFRGFLPLAVITALAFGCGGGDGAAGACGQVQPCGGDIRGNWTIVDSCLNKKVVMTQISAGLATLCPTATVTDATLKSTGSFSFTAASYTALLSSTGSATVAVPMSCLGGLSCSALNGLLQLQLLTNPEPGVQSVTCAGAASCTCTVVPTPQMTNETGTYSVSGSTLLTTSSDGTMDSQDYCVRGSTVHFLTVDRTTTMGQTMITGDVVATKK